MPWAWPKDASNLGCGKKSLFTFISPFWFHLIQREKQYPSTSWLIYKSLYVLPGMEIHYGYYPRGANVLRIFHYFHFMSRRGPHCLFRGRNAEHIFKNLPKVWCQLRYLDCIWEVSLFYKVDQSDMPHTENTWCYSMIEARVDAAGTYDSKHGFVISGGQDSAGRIATVEQTHDGINFTRWNVFESSQSIRKSTTCFSRYKKI